MLDEAELGRWRAAATETLAAGRDNAERGWHSWACVMAEQAAQLSLKGLLHGVGAAASARGHDLVVLLTETSERAGLEATDDLPPGPSGAPPRGRDRRR